jgi:protein-L-isoaspartate(D-aspartate) O-methyltransferase
MVKQQIETRGVTDRQVLAAMGKVPRHKFVPREQRSLAYGDFPLPLGEGQTISQPYMVAAMTELLRLKADDKVLEIGTGSGYQCAILAEIAKFVVSIERIGLLADRASNTLQELGYQNVKIVVGDGTQGYPPEAPYDAILVTAGAPLVPEPLLEQLNIGGTIVIPVGDRFSQILYVQRKIKDNQYELIKSTPCRFVDLIGKDGWE